VASRWNLVVFDWDGTLMDSTGAIVRAAQAAIADLSLPARPDRSIREIIGLGLEDSWSALFPELDMDDYRAFVDSYRDHFVQRERYRSRLYPGVGDVLEQLRSRGHRLAVATGKSRHGLDHDLGVTGLARWFHCSRTADESRSKPHPDMLLHIMGELAIEPSATLMIGDTDYDLQMAQAAGAGSVAVAWGAHDRQRLSGQRPLACLDTLLDLPGWLEDFEADLA